MAKSRPGAGAYRRKPAGGRRLRDRDFARRPSRRVRALGRLLPRLAVLAAVVGAAAAIAMTPVPARLPPALPQQPVPEEHITFHLAIFNGTQPVEIPAGIGQDPSLYNDHRLDSYSTTQGVAVVHTLDASGTVYVDSKVVQPFYFGDFWHQWNQPYGPARTLDFRSDANHTLTISINGKVGVGSTSWGQIVLADKMQIEIRYNTV